VVIMSSLSLQWIMANIAPMMGTGVVVDSDVFLYFIFNNL
jgi:hypothetical protein